MSESQNIEWKETWRDEYLKWVCGFANAQGGGLEIGKNDRGEVVEVKNILRLLEEIPNKAQSLLGIVSALWLRFPFSAAYQAADSATTPKTTQEQEKTREKILTLIFANPSITTAELANQLEITAKGIEWQISKLKRMGVLERIGPARGGHWKIVETEE